MITAQAHKLTDYLCKQQIIKEEEKSIYYFCFEVVLSTAYFWAMVLILALISGQILESLVYLAAFTLMRSAAGGYHAASHWRCMILSAASFAAFLLIEIFLPEAWLAVVLTAGGIYIIYMIGRFAPIYNHNNPFTAEERQLNRNKSLFVLCVLVVCLLLLMAVGVQHLAFCLFLGLVQAAAALNIAILMRRGGDSNEKHLAQSTDYVG